jgi:hypothetical protein
MSESEQPGPAPEITVAPADRPPVAGLIDPKDMADVARAAVERAKTGDPLAAHVACRIWLRQTVRIDLPPIDDVAGVARAQLAVIGLVAGGHLTPRTGRDFTTMLDHRRRAIETQQLEEQLQELLDANAADAEKNKNRRGRP